MTRFLVWTDLHDEFWRHVPDVPLAGFDAVLLGGDISTRGRHVAFAHDVWQQCERPIIMVRGNHEFYGSVIPDLIAREQEKIAALLSQGVDIRVLDGDVTFIGETRIIGATLWTDLGLYPGYDQDTRKAVRLGMNDFNQIRMSDNKHLDVEDWLAMHWGDREALLSHISQAHEGPTIVMTHHIPVRQLIHPLREMGPVDRNLMNAGFASDMAWQIKDLEVDAWICGHSHDNRRAEIIGEKRTIPFITNARGYPKEGCAFDPGFVLNVRT